MGPKYKDGYRTTLCQATHDFLFMHRNLR